MNSPLRRRLLAGLPILAVVSIVLAAGCSGHKQAEAPKPERNMLKFKTPFYAPTADPNWDTNAFIEFNESGNSVTIGYMNTISCGNQAMYDYLDATRDRREALADSINAWHKKINRGVYDRLKGGIDPQVLIDGMQDEIGQPINPFLSVETLSGEGDEDFMERIADDIYFAEETLGMSLYQFQSHVGHHLEEKIKHYLEPETNTKIKVSDDVCPAPESSEWPDSLTGLIDVTQADAEDRLKQVEEEFELKKPTMSQSEIEIFELQLRIAKEAFRYLKEQTEEFKRLIEDE
ncbi:MAG: hypothetical protein OXT74_07195 [Candidatus Poribacteria bacterium]|nr:hypothetical protein [Candidatus Poribacteria bacterium]